MTFDETLGEFLLPLPQVVEDLAAAGIAEKSEGPWWSFSLVTKN